MSKVQVVVGDDLRVIMCLAFDHRAPVEELTALKQCVVDCPQVLHSIELSGAFDFMLEVTLPTVAAYHAELAARASTLARLVERYETCFVCKRYIRQEHDERAIWVPCPDGLKRLDCAQIDKVTADGDYMLVHSGNNRWLVHSTMKALCAKLHSDEFVRIHRSSLVRRDFVDRLVHHGHHWVARLDDGSEYPIAKSHLAEVMTAIQAA